MQNTPTAHQARLAEGQAGSPGVTASTAAKVFMLVQRAWDEYGFTYQKNVFHNRNQGGRRARVRRWAAERNQHLRPVANGPEGLRGDRGAPRRRGAAGFRTGP